MIHFSGSHGSPLMLSVTLGATADVRMKGGGLALQQIRLVGVANHATDGSCAFDWRMARATVVLQVGMRSRQRPGVDHALHRVDDFRLCCIRCIRVRQPKHEPGNGHHWNQYV